jgi:phenylacetate-CoA ligase
VVSEAAPRRSRIPDVRWPAVPDDYSARILSIHGQMQESEWWPPEVMAVHQQGALDRLLDHARATVPFYRDDPAYAPGTPWNELPILTRAAVQDAGVRLRSDDVPADHLPVSEASSSGSTGRPLTVRTTRAWTLFFTAVTLRDHLWHRRDPSATIAVIRAYVASGAPPPEGIRHPVWGLPVHPIYESGPMFRLPIETDVAVQADWLVGVDPDYLLTLPSNLVGLAQHCRLSGQRLPRLREVRTLGEVLSPEVRRLCRDVFGVPVTDMYSAVELGYIALQCPTAQTYHVQSEVTCVEVVDEEGAPCPPGQTGRVIATPLHNFAQPLIRYESGDVAEVGRLCPCGRGLPVLNRVVGRQRNLITLPSGERFWPLFSSAWRGVDAIHQIQIVQHDLEHVEARIVGPRPLTADEEATFTAKLHELFRHPFRVSFEYRERIDRTQQRKFEDFVSRIPGPG